MKDWPVPASVPGHQPAPGRLVPGAHARSVSRAAAPRLPDDGHGVGLATMRERIAAAGGSLAVERALGEGTALALLLPVAKGDEDDA